MELEQGRIFLGQLNKMVKSEVKSKQVFGEKYKNIKIVKKEGKFLIKIRSSKKIKIRLAYVISF